jgi:hypothetical protein
MPIDEERHAFLPALLKDRTLTHRVTGPEVDLGFLNGGPDLEPFSILTEDHTYKRLVDGSELVEAITDVDAGLFEERGIVAAAVEDFVWLLQPDALRRLGVAEGDVVAVTVRADGFELGVVAEVPEPEDVRARLRGPWTCSVTTTRAGSTTWYGWPARTTPTSSRPPRIP